MRPRVLFVGRTRYRLPLAPSLARKWDALAELMELRVLASGIGSDPRFVLVAPRRLDGPRFYTELTGRVARELRRFRPDVVVAESPFEALAVEAARTLTRSPARVVVEVHGDWRASTRLYGSRFRAALGPLADRLGAAGVRRGDGVRALSGFTASLVREQGREPLAVFPTYSDLGAFAGPCVAIPAEPRLLFVGVLERYKGIETLARAWRLVAGRLPDARLELVGSGSQSAIAAGLERAGAEWHRRLEPAEVVRALDRARALVLPSNSEGLGRVIIEAFLRCRPAVASRVGGIPDLVSDGENGLLVAAGDADALAAAIERVLTDERLASRLGSRGRETAAAWTLGAEEYAARVLGLVEAVLGSGSGAAAGRPPRTGAPGSAAAPRA
jgi:glycosyltransferase involved in cell wall biosynthesis